MNERFAHLSHNIENIIFESLQAESKVIDSPFTPYRSISDGSIELTKEEKESVRKASDPASVIIPKLSRPLNLLRSFHSSPLVTKNVNMPPAFEPVTTLENSKEHKKNKYERKEFYFFQVKIHRVKDELLGGLFDVRITQDDDKALATEIKGLTVTL